MPGVCLLWALVSLFSCCLILSRLLTKHVRTCELATLTIMKRDGRKPKSKSGNYNVALPEKRTEYI